ncbi:MAG TPA: GyrI-like domain-containing protein [Verrucomicrobiae bacterium]|jgi:hypothetical protein
MKPRKPKEKLAAKLDLYKVHKSEYVTPKKPSIVQTRPAKYLTISGQGTPGGERFIACIAALYGAAFTIKMNHKFSGMQDYAVCKLECRWFFGGDPAEIPRAKWKWTLMIRTPDFISGKDLVAAVEKSLKKGKAQEIKEVRLEKIDEGRCIQMLHVGPYEKECESMALMREFATANGLKFDGPFHEIYLSDPRRVPAACLKTILRQGAVKM